MTVVIKGISQRAKNRIREHGNTFTFFPTWGGCTKRGAVLLCTGPTMEESKWFGWFEFGEIEIERVIVDKSEVTN